MLTNRREMDGAIRGSSGRMDGLTLGLFGKVSMFWDQSMVGLWALRTVQGCHITLSHAQ